MKTANYCPWIYLCVLAALGPCSVRAADALVILPSQFTLTGTEAHQQILIERTHDGRFVGQVLKDMELTSSNPQVVIIKNGEAIPAGNGQAVLSAKTEFGTAAAQVVVTGMDKPFTWSFRNHVQPVLMRMGCSTGACHGAAAGKNGFKLSLRGYDDDGDYRAITRQAFGRRVNPADPARSLLLTKPTAAIPHKGGQRFEVDSMEYRVISQWLASGMPAPKADDARIERLEILPENAILKSGSTAQLIVRAHFNDNHSEDVTRWVKYTSANASVVQVDDTGNLKIVGNGEGAITAWYLSRIAIATVSVPYETEVPAEVFAHAAKRNFIDELVLEKLQSLNIPPSPSAGDNEFIRRAFIDTIGVLPTADEVRAFAADPAPAPAKRDHLIDKLLERTEYVDYWSYKWSDLLLVNSEKLSMPATWSYYKWIRQNVASNTPWDSFVRQLVTAKGSTLENGAGNFFVLHDDPAAMAETTSLAFMGLSINCAKCHNHPMEKWTNNQYYGMANLFARVRTKNGPGDGNRIVFSATEGDVVQPLTGRPQRPQPLDGTAIPLEATDDRREHLADWLVSRDNPYFCRAITNRVWANFMGVGLIESVDDLRVTNPSSNEKLLSGAAKFLADNKFDLKALMRAILQSETYQRSSQLLSGNAADQRFYSHFYPRRIMAEVLLDAMSQVTGAPTEFTTYPRGWRAMQLPDSNVSSYFLKSFGRPNRLTTCDCERSSSPSMAQVLHISNGDTLNKKLGAKMNLIESMVQQKTPNEKIIETAFVSALSRNPTETEKTKLLKVLADSSQADNRQLTEDVYWGVLSSKEFLFNH